MQTFNDLSLGELFCFSGSVWKKQSTRTAFLYCKAQEPGEILESTGAWFYFGKAERVNNS